MNKEENTKLTDEQIDDIAEQMDEAIKGTVLEDIKNLPSNNGVLERPLEEAIKDEGEMTTMNVVVDPNTGENKIIGSTTTDEEDDESFEEMCKRIADSNIVFESAPISEEEIIEYLGSEDSSNDSILKEISSDVELDPDTIRGLLNIVNRKNNGERFNVYRAFPEEIQKMVDKYIRGTVVNTNLTNSKDINQYRNFICESLIQEFITNINIDRVKQDFNKDIESLFKKGSEEIGDTIVGYTYERNKAYREYADKIDDEDKKRKLNNILDRIDEAFNLTELKEFGKRCKIKSFDLEKPKKFYGQFLNKYADSTYNIYDIYMTRPILFRNLTELYPDDEITDKDIDAFLICFCKQVTNMSPDNTLDHAYMYYVIYNIVLVDVNKGENKKISDEFLGNVKEVIDNLRIRNKNFK